MQQIQSSWHQASPLSNQLEKETSGLEKFPGCLGCFLPMVGIALVMRKYSSLSRWEQRVTLPIWAVHLPHGPGSHLTPYIPKLINMSPSPTNMPEPGAAALEEEIEQCGGRGTHGGASVCLLVFKHRRRWTRVATFLSICQPAAKSTGVRPEEVKW